MRENSIGIHKKENFFFRKIKNQKNFLFQTKIIKF